MAKNQINRLEQINQILDGIKNNIIPNVQINQVARLRMRICKECQPHNTLNCEVCGCLLKIKTKSEKAKCPKDLW